MERIPGVAIQSEFTEAPNDRGAAPSSVDWKKTDNSFVLEYSRSLLNAAGFPKSLVYHINQWLVAEVDALNGLGKRDFNLKVASRDSKRSKVKLTPEMEGIAHSAALKVLELYRAGGHRLPLVTDDASSSILDLIMNIEPEQGGDAFRGLFEELVEKTNESYRTRKSPEWKQAEKAPEVSEEFTHAALIAREAQRKGVRAYVRSKFVENREEVCRGELLRLYERGDYMKFVKCLAWVVEQVVVEKKSLQSPEIVAEITSQGLEVTLVQGRAKGVITTIRQDKAICTNTDPGTMSVDKGYDPIVYLGESFQR